MAVIGGRRPGRSPWAAWRRTQSVPRHGGADLIVVGDREAGRARFPSPACSPSGAINAAFVDAGRRDACDLLVDAGGHLRRPRRGDAPRPAPRRPPWHAIALAREIAGSRGNEELAPDDAEARLLEALEHGLRKVLARMGISTLASYRGGQLFDAIGLADEVAERCFPAAPRIAGSATFARLGGESLSRHAAAYLDAPARPRPRRWPTPASPASAPTGSTTPSPRRS